MSVSTLIWLLAFVLAILIARALGASLGHRQRRLPGNFDFDRYKAREITQRGVFDKTKWH
jgi:hypothetical protein